MARITTDGGGGVTKSKADLTGRDTPGAGAGLGGSYAPINTPKGPPVVPQPPLGGDGSTSGSGSDRTDQKTAPPAPTDWSIFLGTFAGMDQSLINQLNDIWTKSGGDANTATPLIMGAVQGSDWFKNNYPGYFNGLNHGLYGDIRGYVSFENDVNTLYTQYYGRVATGTEISGYLTKGLTPSYISSQLQSSAMQGTLTDPMKNTFTPDELKAYTDERSGIDTKLGQQMLGEVNLFSQVSPLFQSFYGRAPTRDELNVLTKNGTDPSQVAQQFKAAGYLNSVPDYLKNVFSEGELQQMATEAAGGDSQNGKQLLDMANLASSLNQVYQVHYGSNVSRDELNLAYSQGYTAQHVDSMLASGEYANALPANVKSLFTPDELKQAGEQASGFSSSDQGNRILNIVKNAGNYAGLASQYGDALTGDQLKSFYDNGVSANDYGNQLAGKSWAKANASDIQQAAGSFGEGALSQDQLNALGSEKAGYDTPQGQQLMTAYSKAVTRMNGAFGSILARSGDFGALQNRKQIQADTSDVAA